MQRMKVNAAKLNEWLDANQPNAREKLSAKTGYSVASIDSIRRSSRIPRLDKLSRLAKVIGCEVMDLVVSESRKRDSE